MHRFVFILLAAALAAPSFAVAQSGDETPPARPVVIRAIEGLRFDPPRFEAKRGETIELSVENHDANDQPHNFVLIEPGTLAEIQTASMAISPALIANGFVPDHPAVLAQTGLLNPDGVEKLRLTVPKKRGVYPFVCTFPGHALVMFGALYVDTKIDTGLAYDPHLPELVRNIELEKLKTQLAVERPAFYRLFMPGSGPAAIAVALPGDLNFCWDAGNCRLRYVWQGGFVDATAMWNSNGNALAGLLGDIRWSTGGDETTAGIRFGDSPSDRVEFSGYQLIDGIPRFEYRVGGVAVREQLTPATGGLAWTFEVESPPGDVRVLAPDSIALTSATGRRDGAFWVVPQSEASAFTLNLPFP